MIPGEIYQERCYSDSMARQTLTTLQMQVLSFIEEFWHKFHKFPSVDVVCDKFPSFNLNTNLKDPTFAQSLENRGIIIDSSVRGLTEDQIAAILCLSDFEDKRSRARKLRDLGLTSTKWNGWLKDKAFRNFLHNQFAFNFEESTHVAQDALVRAMDKGDTNAIKFYMEMTGQYTQQAPQMVNIKLILARVIESIQRHVQDPEILKAIGNDFELIMQGGAPVDRSTLMIENII